jgi:hypothetical protein
LQRASAEERELVTKLARDSTAVAGEVGRSDTGSLEERIRATLHAAALDDQTAAELAAGRLVREREAVGLFGAASLESGSARSQRRDAGAAVPGKRGRDRSGTGKVAERRRKLERELAAARADKQKAVREHASAAKATERARKQASGAQRRADEARTRAEDARVSLRAAERRERHAAVARDRAARAVASVEKKLD